MRKLGPKNNRNNSDLIPLLLLLIAVGTLYFLKQNYYQKNNTSGEESLSSELSRSASKGTFKNNNFKYKDEKRETLVNKHLQSTYHQMELNKLKVQIENKKFAPELGRKIYEVEASPSKESIVFDANPNDLLVTEHIRPKSEGFNYNSPDDYIQNEKLKDQRLSEYNESYKEEYVRAFIDNAYKNGYDVKVDENLVVTSVKPIKPKQNQMTLNPTGGAAK